jgi:hypothetical protein
MKIGAEQMNNATLYDKSIDELFDMIRSKIGRDQVAYAEALKIFVLSDITNNLECVLHQLSKIQRALARDEPELIKTGKKEHEQT